MKDGELEKMRERVVRDLAEYMVLYGRLHGQPAGDVLWQTFQSQRPKFLLMAEIQEQISRIRRGELWEAHLQQLPEREYDLQELALQLAVQGARLDKYNGGWSSGLDRVSWGEVKLWAFARNIHTLADPAIERAQGREAELGIPDDLSDVADISGGGTKSER